MTLHDIFKEFVIPALSATVAAVTLALFAVNERRKIVLAADHTRKANLDAAVRAAYREVRTLREQYQLFRLTEAGNQPVSDERKKTVVKTADRVFAMLRGNPALYDEYFSSQPSRLNRNKIDLVLGELEIQMQLLSAASTIERRNDNFTLFGVYALIYGSAYGRDDERAEAEQILSAIAQSDPVAAACWK
jgi:hypothetical protein